MSKLENLWYTRCGVPTAVGIAVQLGWIEEEFTRDGIKISSVREASDKNQRQSHYDHSLDNSFRQGGSVPAIWTKANGRNTKLVGLTWTDEAQVIFAKPGSDIRSVKDLKGKRLGIASRPDDVIDFWNATTRRVYAIALELAGISEKDVEFVELPRHGNSFDDPNRTQRRDRPEDLIEVKALLEGKVDVIFHKGSRGLEIVDAIGGQVIFDTWKDPEARKRANNHSPRTLTVDAQLAEDHPDIVTRLVKRTLQAGQWADAHPQQTIEYVARDELVGALGQSGLRWQREPEPEDRPRRVFHRCLAGLRQLLVRARLPAAELRSARVDRPASTRRGQGSARRARAGAQDPGNDVGHVVVGR